MDYESMSEYWKGHEDGYNQKPYVNVYDVESDQNQAYANGFQFGKLEIERKQYDNNH